MIFLFFLVPVKIPLERDRNESAKKKAFKVMMHKGIDGSHLSPTL